MTENEFRKKSLFSKIKTVLEPVGSLLKDDFFRIPKYQRGFAWDKDMIQDFWDDLAIQMDQTAGGGHFFGILILAETTESSDERYEALEVVDGQQRLISFIILLRALHDTLQNDDHDRQLVQNIKDRIWDSGYAPRLKVGARDLTFYTNWFTKFDDRAKSRSGKSKSELLMKQAYQVFIDAIAARAKELEQDKATVAREIWDTIDGSKKFFVLKLIVPTEADAFTIFETINAKREDLTASELIKNSVLGYAKKNNIFDFADESWEEMLENLAGTSEYSSIDPTEFIRHLYISLVGKPVREKDLYRAIRDTYLRNEPSLSAFLTKLALEAQAYASIAHGNETLDTEEVTISLDCLKTLNDMGYKQIRPLLLSLVSGFKSQGIFDETIRFVEAYAVRASLARISPSAIEDKFASLAKIVREDPDSGIEQIKIELVKSSPSDEIIHASVMHEDARIPKVILKSMERRSAEMNAKDDVMKRAQLEHILPQNPENRNLDSYEGIDDDNFESYLNKFGNLTLLGGFNPRLSNKQYEIKVEKYKDSGYFITQTLARKYEHWGAKQIKERSEEIARYIIKEWKI